MRSLLLCLVVAVGIGWLAVRHLPRSEAQTDALDARALSPQLIRSIALDGQDLPLAALRDVLQTRAGDAIDLAKLAQDRAALTDALIARGYFAARVPEPRVTFGATGTFVVFAIEQGPLFRIRNVLVTGASMQDAGVVTLSSGETADATRIAQAREALEARLHVRGKRSVVVSKLVHDVSAGLVDLELSATR